MCDTLCAVGEGGTVFAKSSDRPVHEVQLIECHPRRPGGRRLATQYLEIDDAGAAATLLSRPGWLWGAEHGVNEHGVAIGNEKVYTSADPYACPPALIGMDLVRLGLERGRSADGALEAMVALLERHGQGGVGDLSSGELYFSSFMVADRRGGWILETSGSRWAARPVGKGAAISNRLTLACDWTRASADVAPGEDVGTWRPPGAPTGFADGRLAASRALLGTAGSRRTARGVVAHMRDHGEGPWGEPGCSGTLVEPPSVALPDGTGITLCMHLRGYQATTSSMVAELPSDPGAPLRAWVAPGSPCVSVFLPVFPPVDVPAELGRPRTWRRFAELRDRVEADREALVAIRAVLDPLEAELWDEADRAADDPDPAARQRLVAGEVARVEAALDAL